MNIERRPSPKIDTSHYRNPETIITIRNSNQIYKSLSLPDNYFSKDDKILSIGGGFSDFSTQLFDQGFDIVDIDPIFHICDYIKNMSVNEAKEYLGKHSDEKVRLRDFRDDEYTPVSFKLEKGRMVGSVYKLPFANNSFDKIVSNRLVEHIDFSHAIPEITRVLKDGGEIRFGLPMLSINIYEEEKTLSNGLHDFDGFEYEFNENCGFKTGMEFLKHNPNFKIYLISSKARRSEIRMNGGYQISTMIIRQDDKIPEYQPRDIDASDPNLGAMFQVDFTLDHESKYWNIQKV